MNNKSTVNGQQKLLTLTNTYNAAKPRNSS